MCCLDLSVLVDLIPIDSFGDMSTSVLSKIIDTRLFVDEDDDGAMAVVFGRCGGAFPTQCPPS